MPPPSNARKSSVSYPTACASQTAWLWEARLPGGNSEAALLWLQLDFNSSAADGRLYAFLDGYQVEGHAAFVAHCHASLPSSNGKTKLARGVQTSKVRHGREMIDVSMQHGFRHPHPSQLDAFDHKAVLRAIRPGEDTLAPLSSDDQRQGGHDHGDGASERRSLGDGQGQRGRMHKPGNGEHKDHKTAIAVVHGFTSSQKNGSRPTELDSYGFSLWKYVEGPWLID